MRGLRQQDYLQRYCQQLYFPDINHYALKRFHNTRALSGIVQGGIYFNASEEDLSMVNPVEDNAT
jgi:hypothetical protein